MRKYKVFLVLFFAFCMSPALAQYKYEREHRIKKSQFPEVALQFISEKLEGARRLRFYREIDSAKVCYEAKFKKDRLHYSIEFDKEGTLEDIEIEVKEVDIPNEAMGRIKEDLGDRFRTHRIRKIQQQYSVRPGEPEATTIRNAFQNLLLPSIKYELIVAGKKEKAYKDFEVVYTAEGKFISIRQSLPANYDHVLY